MHPSHESIHRALAAERELSASAQLILQYLTLNAVRDTVTTNAAHFERAVQSLQESTKYNGDVRRQLQALERQCQSLGVNESPADVPQVTPAGHTNLTTIQSAITTPDASAGKDARVLDLPEQPSEREPPPPESGEISFTTTSNHQRAGLPPRPPRKPHPSRLQHGN